jgi:hypothetical protein
MTRKAAQSTQAEVAVGNLGVGQALRGRLPGG